MAVPIVLVFTDYTSFSASSNDIGCTTRTALKDLTTPFAALVDKEPPDMSIAASSFLSYFNYTSCYLSVESGPQWPSLTRGVMSTSLSEKQSIPTTVVRTSSVPSRSASISQSTAATANTSYPQYTPSASATTRETRNLIVGLVVAIVTVILLVSMGLAYFCLVRRRRRRMNEVIKADHGKNKHDGEGENPQLYLQQKVELDDGQQRHEMEAAELRYEVQGVDEIHELPADKEDGRYCRQELNGDECSGSVEMARHGSRSSG